ncbi:MAG: hypothetical protein V4559_06800 [Pseudomonadota bacterium]
MTRSIRFACGFGFLLLTASVAGAQIAPPTTQQLQQQQNQTIQNETNAAHSNLTQLQIQQAQTQPAPPTVTRSGRVVAHPPGYIPVPGR